jgi:hypothetical protein
MTQCLIRCNKSSEKLDSVILECQKLSRISEKQNFREAEFIDCVRSIAGSEGVTLCRRMLDSIGSRKNNSTNATPEGRCMVCKRSTYPDDMKALMVGSRGLSTQVEEEENDIEIEPVILCDGCNSEAHLSCAGLKKVTHIALRNYDSECVRAHTCRFLILTGTARLVPKD